MTCYVDPLVHNGWVLRGRAIANCHLFTASDTLDELHALAQRIGLKRDWFQPSERCPHYDLTPSRRAAAIAAGAVECSRREAVTLWRARRERIAALMEALTKDATHPAEQEFGE